MNYHNRKFKPVSNSDNGEVDIDMTFHYQQQKNVLFCNYSGGNILKGHLLGKVDQEGKIRMHYHQINKKGELKTGVCSSIPKMVNGKLMLIESWEWTSGDEGTGESVLEEVTNIDKREKLQEDPFTYKTLKDGKLMISRGNKQISIIKGKSATQFLKTAATSNEQAIQLKLAKLTGHYKHGNERK